MLNWCKLLALFVSVLAIVCHGIRLFHEGASSTCFGLMSYGWWRGEIWQPYGCVMHNYSRSDTIRCLKGQRMAVVGDSRMRTVFYQLVSLIDSSYDSKNAKMHANMQFQDKESNVALEFFWKPLPNESMQNQFAHWAESEELAPHVIVISAAMWATKLQGFSEKTVQDFKVNLTKLSNGPIKRLTKRGTDILWIQQMPLVEEMLSHERPYTNSELEKYREAAYDVLKGSSVEVMSSAYVAALGRIEDSKDGLHYGGKMMQLTIDLILNRVCNARLAPEDATCCVPTSKLSPVQLITATVFTGCWLVAIPLLVWKWRQNSTVVVDVESGHKRQETFTESAFNVVISLAKFGLILLYTFLADRTQLFMKESRIYHTYQFLVLVAFIVLLGVVSCGDVSKSELLNREQTEEWRGWMQLVILAYHYTGASQQLAIYVWSRVLVASYIFMSAYGHFSYFWHKGDYSLQRVCQVLFRLNVLTVSLCLTMNRTYQSYYFVPLISFCFLIVYSTMAIWPRITAALVKDSNIHMLLMVAKILGLFVICLVLWRQEKLFDALFSWWPIVELFRTEDGGVREWRFRSGLDRLVVVFGLLFGLAVFVANQKQWISPSNPMLLPLPVAIASLACSFVGLVSYAIFSCSCPNKPDCNAVHSWLSILPIISFILIRNIPGQLRSRYSIIYNWVGKISLELFISQYHIWLANDTKGLLVIIPGYPLINAAVTSFIFVCIAHELSVISGVLAQYAVPKESRALGRRLAIFGVVLALIGILQSPYARNILF